MVRLSLAPRLAPRPADVYQHRAEFPLCFIGVLQGGASLVPAKKHFSGERREWPRAIVALAMGNAKAIGKPGRTPARQGQTGLYAKSDSAFKICAERGGRS